MNFFAEMNKKILAIVILVVLAFSMVLYGYLKANEHARDYQRLSSVSIIWSAMNAKYANSLSYQLPDACEVGAPLVSQACAQGLQDYITVLPALEDPKFTEACTEENCNTGCIPTVYGTSATDFLIYFSLEGATAGLAPGCHQLTKEGIN
jgi:citrate lyase beta subunit